MVEHVLAKDETGVRFSYPAPIKMAQSKIDALKIPEYVTHVTETLEKANFEAFLVGGCVRDLIIGKEPKDWDITTNATPEQIIALFEKTVYENTFGTVGVCIPRISSGVTHVTADTENKAQYNIVEVTPYRIEAKYSDNRHPDQVLFSKNIEDDLKRRDFTINAMAYSASKGHVIDLYKGQSDLKDKVVRAVGNASDRFNEDALRMLRAVRFSTQLEFAIEYDTMQAIIEKAYLLENISKERIRDELIKIIESRNPSMGIGLLSKLGL